MALPSRTAALTNAGAVRAVCITILSTDVCMDSAWTGSATVRTTGEDDDPGMAQGRFERACRGV